MGIRIMAAAAAVFTAVLTVTLAPASARSCEERNVACAEANPGSPLRLDKFMKHNRPAKAAQAAATKPVSAKSAPALSARAEQPRETMAQSMDDAADSAGAAEASGPDVGPVRTIETNGVAVTAPDELNEIDAMAGQVKVVAADELNEIDLAASTAAVPAQETNALGSMASADDPVADTAWIGKLLAAVAGTIAVAAAARLLIA